MKSIIITGASGFVGKNLIAFCFANDIGVTQRLSIRNAIPKDLPVSDAIVHLAGKAHDLENASNPQEYFLVNFEKTRELFDLFLNSECADFIYFSSVKAVADTVEGILSEGEKGNPKTPYGQSKHKAEQYLFNRKLPEGKRLFIIRPCMIHGPGNKGNLNLLYKVVKKGIPYPLGSFDNKRSFLSIDNLLFVLERIINDRSIPGGIYNVADDEPLSTNSLIKIIGEASRSTGRIWHIPKGLITGIAKLGDKLNLLLNSERLKKLTESYVVSNDKIKRAIGISKLPVSSKEGLIKTIRSFDN